MNTPTIVAADAAYGGDLDNMLQARRAVADQR
jgi:hypothetical protein